MQRIINHQAWNFGITPCSHPCMHSCRESNPISNFLVNQLQQLLMDLVNPRWATSPFNDSNHLFPDQENWIPQLETLSTQVITRESIGHPKLGRESTSFSSLQIQHTTFSHICRPSFSLSWFKVVVSAADSTGTVSYRSRRNVTDSGDTCKTLQIKL